MSDLETILGPAGGYSAPSSVEETDAAIAKMAKGDAPEPPPAYDNQVTLMRGLEDESSRIAEVRELNGYDEEIISRFQSNPADAGNVASQLNRVAELGTVTIGGRKPSLSDIEALLVGDRNLLVMAIRRLTYGLGIEGSIACRGCQEMNEISIDPWSDLEYVPWDGEMFYDVELREGRRATVRRMTAADQRAAFERDTATIAERNSLFLERMVMDIDRKTIHSMQSVAANATRSLGIIDRRTLLDTMVEQPGFQFGKEVDGHCASCGTSLGLVLEVADLLRG